MKSKNYSALVFTLTFLFGACWLYAQNTNSFALKVDSEMRKISVEASLETKGTYLLMNWEAATFIPDGWSQFVTDIHAYGPDNEPIEL